MRANPIIAPPASPNSRNAGGQPRPAAIEDERRRHQVEAHRRVTAGKRKIASAGSSLPDGQKFARAAELYGGVRPRAAPAGFQHAIDEDSRADQQQQREEQPGVAARLQFRPEEAHHPDDDSAAPENQRRIHSPVADRLPRLLLSKRKAYPHVRSRNVARKKGPDRSPVEVGGPKQHRGDRQHHRGNPNGRVAHQGNQSCCTRRHRRSSSDSADSVPGENGEQSRCRTSVAPRRGGCLLSSRLPML